MAVTTTGQAVTVTWLVVDNLGNPAATTVTVSLTDPAGTVTAPTVANPSLGTYTFTVTPSVAGIWAYSWSGTGAFARADQGVFEVAAPTLEIVSLDDVKAHLNIAASDTSQDAELKGFIYASRPIIEDLTGPIVNTTYTEFFDGGSQKFVVSHQPLVSVTSIYEYYGLSSFLLTEQPLGTQTSAFAFTVDYTTGQVTRRTYGGQAAMFAIGDKNIKATYVSGYSASTVPWNVRLATLELVRHLFSQTQLRGRAKMAADNETGFGGTAFAVPNFVLELLQPHRRPPGVA